MPDYIGYFWDRISEGEFWIQYCPDCGQYIFYPRDRCPGCWHEKPEWRKCRGRGRVYSYTIVHSSALAEWEKEVPYIYAIIELEEGVRMASNIVGCGINEVEVGMPVTLDIIDRQGQKLPVFRPE